MSPYNVILHPYTHKEFSLRQAEKMICVLKSTGKLVTAKTAEMTKLQRRIEALDKREHKKARRCDPGPTIAKAIANSVVKTVLQGEIQEIDEIVKNHVSIDISATTKAIRTRPSSSMIAPTPSNQKMKSKQAKSDEDRGDKPVDRGDRRVGIPTSSKPSHQNFGRK